MRSAPRWWHAFIAVLYSSVPCNPHVTPDHFTHITSDRKEHGRPVNEHNHTNVHAQLATKVYGPRETQRSYITALPCGTAPVVGAHNALHAHTLVLAGMSTLTHLAGAFLFSQTRCRMPLQWPPLAAVPPLQHLGGATMSSRSRGINSISRRPAWHRFFQLSSQENSHSAFFFLFLFQKPFNFVCKVTGAVPGTVFVRIRRRRPKVGELTCTKGSTCTHYRSQQQVPRCKVAKWCSPATARVIRKLLWPAVPPCKSNSPQCDPTGCTSSRRKL